MWTLCSLMLIPSLLILTAPMGNCAPEKEVSLKIAAVSCKILPGEPEANMKQVAKWTRLAAEQGADLVLFNETNVTGYWMSRQTRALAEPLHGPIVKELTALAAENDIIIAAGMVESSRKKQHNTHVLVGPKGLVGFHRKSSLPSGEEQWFDIGHDTNVFQVRGVKIGIAICYESVQPDTCKALASKGAQVILAPYCNGVTAEEISIGKRPYFQQRARENGVWYIACDQCGVDRTKPEKPVDRAGAVCFVNPLGEIVATTSLDESGEHMIVHEVTIESRGK